jgi:hypothetical protein
MEQWTRVYDPVAGECYLKRENLFFVCAESYPDSDGCRVQFVVEWQEPFHSTDVSVVKSSSHSAAKGAARAFHRALARGKRPRALFRLLP